MLSFTTNTIKLVKDNNKLDCLSAYNLIQIVRNQLPTQNQKNYNIIDIIMQQQQQQQPQSSNHQDQVSHSQNKYQTITTVTANNIKHAEVDCKNQDKKIIEVKQDKKDNMMNCQNELLYREEIKQEKSVKQEKEEKKVQQVVKEWSKETGIMNDACQKNPQLYMQLLSMGFQQNLIRQSMKIHNNLDKSIEYIINKLQKSDPIPIKQPTISKQSQNNSSFEDVEQQHKMIFLVRTDLKMGLGKIAAQVAHATLKAYKQMITRASQNDFDFIALEEWKEMGQKKIVVKVDGQAELLGTIGKAKDKGINCCYIRDAGLTQVASGSITVAAIGPAPSSEIDLLTKQYKLL